jgi:RNA polymerase sigma-70 factor, ECF subfamily
MDGSPHASNERVGGRGLHLRRGADQENALDEIASRELGTAIEAAIGHLRPEYRSCIMLRHVEGRSYEEIASTLDLPLGTVKTYIHRARHELRRALEDLRS